VKRTFSLHAVVLTIAVAVVAPAGWAQRAVSGEIELRQALERLNTLGSAMMIAAHPDDENTALIAYLSRGRQVRTGYLALTRGEGGQNLIGAEQGDELGIIRTQELLAARRIDGGEQFFTRAIDFGFSKTAQETLSKWPRDQVLGDIVWNIRRFRPDVIILRFSGTPRDGHGHHQTSAILGREAYTAAADPTKFPEQLKYVQPWQAHRLMMNVAAFNQQQEREAAQAKDRLEIDLGAYSPELGYSYGEIAGMSRSQHRSQGMGTAERKGAQKNYFETLAGDIARKDIFEGVDLTWNRLPGGAPVGMVMKQALDQFVPARPEELLPALAKARPMIASIAASTKDPLAERKLRELDETMVLASGLWLEAQADRYSVTPGSAFKVNIEAVLRRPVQVALTGARLTGMEGAPALNLAPVILANNQPQRYSVNVKVPDTEPYSQPYWLQLPKDGPMYRVADPQLIGNPENKPVLEAHFSVRIAGTDLDLVRPVEHRYVDRVYGELLQPLAVVPPVAVELSEHALVFADSKPRQIEVPIRSNSGKQSGDVHLEVPEGWHAEPASRHFELSFTGEQTMAVFEITAPGQNARGTVKAVAAVGGRMVSQGTEIISYPHFPVQTLFPPAEASLVRADIKLLSKNIGYVMGAGDEVPKALRQIGAEVTLLSSEDLARGNLARFDAIVTGVRAWNVRPDLRANYQRLFDYVSNGGTMVVQYNTPEGVPQQGQQGQGQQGQGQPGQGQPGQGQAQVDNQAPGPGGGPPGTGPAVDTTTLEHIGPYPIHTSRDRVTMEDAPVVFPNPNLSVLRVPNLITVADFDDWVQERGLNFPDHWDSRYESVLESHDTGDKELPGGTLYTKYGKGVYIFTAYDWFRELPAGVPGAYRVFANFLSAGKAQ
jgi:LmbE family N-acetylglucosaminyl deacetylase